MLLYLARISAITIAITLVAGIGILLARPQAPTVITVVVPPQHQVAAPTTVVQASYPYWPHWGYPYWR